MHNRDFSRDKSFLLAQFDNIVWTANTGLAISDLEPRLREIELSCAPFSLVRALSIALILREARLSLDPRSHFAEMIDAGDFLLALRERRLNALRAGEMAQLIAKHEPYVESRAYDGNCDFGHVAPDWESALALGFPGLLERVRRARVNNPDSAPFYDELEIVYEAIIAYISRLSKACAENGMDEAAHRLAALAVREPRDIPEAYQFMDITYVLFTLLEGENLRSLGRLDSLLGRMFERDIASGRLTREALTEYTKHFFAKMHAYRFGANVPFTLGGVERDGREGVNAFSYFLLETYREFGAHDPKMQIRVSDGTPSDFLRLVCECIRAGLTSFVFINDNSAIPAMRALGADERDARDYVLIGCYEPAIAGREVPCTCNGTVNLARAVTETIKNNRDCGSFEEFFAAFEATCRRFAGGAIELTNAWERHYGEINPAPIFSGMLPDCVERGLDVYLGGAKYNNSSINNIGLATAADSLAAIKTLVFDEGKTTLKELSAALDANWAGYEALRRLAINRAPKFGNADLRVDSIAAKIVALAAEAINGRPNARAGKYRSGFFSINWNISYGEKTEATPDGRGSGEPLSKNFCAAIGRDKGGVTALIRSVAVLDSRLIPNGSVLDVMLHPTTTSGAAGLDVMERLVRTYAELGCFGIHFNIFDAAKLRAAQNEPEKYATLQVRVCGWNEYFVNLSEFEQNQFILRAEAIS